MSIACALLLHLASAHFEPGYRSDTHGAGVVCEADDYLAAAGSFRNSEGGSSVYAVGGWQPLRLGLARIGAVGGLINGYTCRDGGIFPFAAGIVSVRLWGDVQARVLAVPHIKGVSAAALQFAVSIPFGDGK